METREGVEVNPAPKIDPLQLLMGAKEEKVEHLDTYRWLSDFVKDKGRMPPIEAFAGQIAADHLLHVDPQYYAKIKKAGL